MERLVARCRRHARAAIHQRFHNPETIFIRSVLPAQAHTARPPAPSISVTMQGRSQSVARHRDLQVGADADVIHIDRGLDRIHFLCVVADVPLAQHGVVGDDAAELQDADFILK